MDKNVKIEYFIGLKGMCAFIVVFHHFVFGFYPALYTGDINQTHTSKFLEIYISNSPLNIFYAGNFVVCIFFILSGFLVTYKFFKYKDSKCIYSGAIKRYFRLVIPSVFSIVIVYIMMRLSLFYNQEVSQISKSEWWLGSFWTFQTNFLSMLREGLIGIFIGEQCNYNPPLWTMTYELYGTMLVLGLIALIGKNKNRYIFYAIACFLFRNSYYLAFILGVYMCDLFTNDSIKNILKTDKRIIIAIYFFSGIYFGAYPSTGHLEGTIYNNLYLPTISNVWMFSHILGAFLVILSILNSKILKKVFSYKYIKKIGEQSFSIYIIHFCIMGSFSSYLFAKLSKYLNYSGTFIITFILSFVLIYSISILITDYVERYGITLSNKIYNYIYVTNEN
jgi:Predicted acyltransferases